MKKSVPMVISGLLATIACLLLIAQGVFNACDGIGVLYNRYMLRMEQIEFIVVALEVIGWITSSLFAASFFALIADPRNRISSLLGGISCALLVLTSCVTYFCGYQPWPLGLRIFGFLLNVGFFVAVGLLRSGVPLAIKVVTVMASVVLVMLDGSFLLLSNMIYMPGIVAKIFGWMCIPCWIVLTVHFIAQLFSRGKDDDASNLELPAYDAFCTTCGAKIHFHTNQQQVVCMSCGVPSYRRHERYIKR